MKLGEKRRWLYIACVVFMFGCAERNVIVEVPNTDGTMVLSFEKESGPLWIRQSYVVAIADGTAKRDIKLMDCSAPGKMFAEWTEDDEHVVLLLDACLIEYLAVDSSTGRTIDPQPFIPILEAAVRGRFDVPVDQTIEQWSRSGSAEAQFNTFMQQNLEKR
ncbi:MAG: hypothetical protein M9913_10735 [Bryobacteraceae bacterium]|nr:hypothetical protein [Solibacteraceae bacterium]MCO5351358.1 hypothetical protein [Bryobacteraceae bacterium]